MGTQHWMTCMIGVQTTRRSPSTLTSKLTRVARPWSFVEFQAILTTVSSKRFTNTTAPRPRLAATSSTLWCGLTHGNSVLLGNCRRMATEKVVRQTDAVCLTRTIGTSDNLEVGLLGRRR